MNPKITKQEEKVAKEAKELLKLQNKIAEKKAKEEAKLQKEQEQKAQEQKAKEQSYKKEQVLFLFIYQKEDNNITNNYFLWVYKNKQVKAVKEATIKWTYKELCNYFLSAIADLPIIDKYDYERAFETRKNCLTEYNANKDYLSIDEININDENFILINLFDSNSIKQNKKQVKGIKGDISPLIELYDSFTNGRGQEFDSEVMLPIFKDANILKSNKLGLVLYGRKSTGKSLFFEIIRMVLGIGNTASTDFTNLKFNSFMKKKLFLFSNDSVTLTPDMIKKIKELATSNTFTVEGKGKDQIPNYPFHSMFGISCEELPIELADANEEKRFMFLQGSKEYNETHYELFKKIMPAIIYHYENHPDLEKKELSNQEKIKKYSKVKSIIGLSLPTLAKEVFINYVIDKILKQDDIEDYIGANGQIYIPVNKTVLSQLTMSLKEEAGVEYFQPNTIHPFQSLESLSKEMIKWDNMKFMNAGAKNNRINKNIKRAVCCTPEILVGRAKEKHTAIMKDLAKETPKEVDLVKEMGVDEEHEEKIWLSKLPEELQDNYYCIKRYYYTTMTGKDLVNGIALLRAKIGECTTPEMINQMKMLAVECLTKLNSKTEQV